MGRRPCAEFFYLSFFPWCYFYQDPFLSVLARCFYFAVCLLMDNLYMNNAVSAKEINYKFNETSGDKWSFDGSVAPSKL